LTSFWFVSKIVAPDMLESKSRDLMTRMIV